MLLLSGTVPRNLLLLFLMSGLGSAASGRGTEFLQQEPGTQNPWAEHTKTRTPQQLKASRVY